MLVNCNSCQKKFTVPDNAITETGRLLQCGSCGNKWTQYPIKKESIKQERPKKETSKITPTEKKQPAKLKKTKRSIKTKKREISLYSEEYLKKKHGLEIKNVLENELKKNSNSSNFFGYLTIIIIFIVALFGVLNITKDFLIINYPFTENYINSLYEVINILSVTISSLIN
ncbi:zinc-ribbon domain-containing protein [Pelagibacteraceae bacterium]|nr:zinc-ribbon domain-containing protein [Pelagibacteraceae bacterium]